MSENAFHPKWNDNIKNVAVISPCPISTNLCRYFYRMVERDLRKGIKNPDEPTKSLRTMRDMLFGQDAMLFTSL